MRNSSTTRRRTRGRIVASVGATVAATVATVGLAAPAAQAATCSGSGCNGLFASETGCADDSRIVATGPIQAENFWTGEPEPTAPWYGWVELWESPTCDTVWAVATQANTAPGTELTAGVTARTAPDTAANAVTAVTTTDVSVRSRMWQPSPKAGDSYRAGVYAYLVSSGRYIEGGSASVYR